MQSLFQLLEKVEIGTKQGPKVEYEFQAIGLEMQEIYGKKVWPLFYKYPLWKIKKANEIARKKDNTSYGYLIGIIKKL